MSRWEALWRVEEILRDRGVDVKEHFPGYVQIKGHEFMYAPSGVGGGHWLHQHKDARSWTRLEVLDESDAERVANSIITHLSTMKKSV